MDYKLKKYCKVKLVLPCRDKMASVPSRHLLVQSQHWKHQYNASIAHFEQISHIILVSPLLPSNIVNPGCVV